MFTAYLIVVVLAAAANIFSATCDFVRYKQVAIAMAKGGCAGIKDDSAENSQSRRSVRIAVRLSPSANRQCRRNRADAVLADGTVAPKLTSNEKV